MNKKPTSLLAFVLASLLPLGASAQTKVVFAPKTVNGQKAASASQFRAAAKSSQKAASSESQLKSLLPLSALSDQIAFDAFTAATGSQPSLVQKVSTSKRRAGEEVKSWTYTGFNIAAGTADDGSQTGGLVNFNIDPFECDTVSSDGGLSPYSYMAKGKLYCFLPHMDVATGEYTTMTRTTYDANTLQRLDQRTVSVPGSKSRVPYLITYDEQRDIVYAISIGDHESGKPEAYYLNVLDTASCQLQRIGSLGTYSSDRKKGNFSPKAFTSTYDGRLLVQNHDDSLYIQQIDPKACLLKTIGRTEMPIEYTYGLQPMYYDNNSGKLIVNHYDFANGTQYYYVSPFLAYGQTDNILNTELIENAPTGFNYFYKRPEAGASYYTYRLADLIDLKTDVSDDGKATVSFTIPDVDDKGNKLSIPSWSNNRVRIYVYVDNTYTTVDGLPSQPKLGDNISFTTNIADGGMHVITVSVMPLYNELQGVKNSSVVTCGYDAPAAVDSPSLTMEDGKAVVTWTAPTEGRYVDFGSKFDATDLTYKVVRNSDGKVIADGITATTAEDTDIADEIQTYSYTIYATSHGQTSVGATTNGVNAGTYLAMPYENNFDESGCLDGYTVLNLNDDGDYRTWYWNSYKNTITSGWGTDEDWLITPQFRLDSGSLYALSYTIQGNGDLRTTVGKGTTPDDQNENILDDVQGYTVDDYTKREFYFHPADTDFYNFGLYNYGVGDECVWNLDQLSVKPIAKVSAPDMVRSLQFVPDAGGALGATLTFNVPATAIDGSSLSSVSKVTVYDLDGNVLGTADNVAPGSQASIKVQAQHGWNGFKIVAANADGEGWPVVLRKFVGPDTPKTVGDLTVSWGDDRTVANLAWTAPTEGVNGGYVDPSSLAYKIYKYEANSSSVYTELGSTEGDTSVEVTILDATKNQDQYVFGVTAVNSEGESDYARGGIVMGEPYKLPVVEPFSAKTGISHSPWLIMSGKNGQNWTLDQGYYNTKIQPENEDSLQLVFLNKGTEDASGAFVAPIIDFTEAEHPVLSVWLHHSDAMPEGAYVNILATTDGSKNYKEVAPKQQLTGNNGWTKHIFDLSALKGKKAQVALNAYLPDPSERIFADNWEFCEADGNDLALAAISQPYMPKVGDKADIAVTVTNLGKETASGYSVLFNLNGETIAEQEAEEPLALGQSATFHFPLAVSAAQKDLVYSAEVLYDGDDNEDNNYSTEVELSPEQIDLPAPTGLGIDKDNTLAWTAPETMDGREVTLDFEDVPAFTIDNINGWTTADLDGTLTVSFVQYYDNYWPYVNQPLAWMTWSAKEAGCASAAAWQPYEGEKCLIAWGNYGADADGRTNDDPVDDWFISPEVKGGTPFSFHTLSNDASSTLEIRTSSTDRQPESFTNVVKTIGYINVAEWEEASVVLPDDAKYVAIHTTNNSFGIMVDNVKYTEAKAPQLKGYNIYCGTELAMQSAVATAKAASNGTYAVSAVYDLGESPLSNSVSVTTGISDISAGVAVSGGKGTITVSGAAGHNVAVYSADGRTVATDKATVSAAPGVYIVKVGTKTCKVSVK